METSYIITFIGDDRPGLVEQLSSVIESGALQGIDAVPVTVEVNGGQSGDPRLIMVGLPDAAVKESDDRVFAALTNTNFDHPRLRTTINLAPGDLKKEGPIYDLPILRSWNLNKCH